MIEANRSDELLPGIIFRTNLGNAVGGNSPV